MNEEMKTELSFALAEGALGVMLAVVCALFALMAVYAFGGSAAIVGVLLAAGSALSLAASALLFAISFNSAKRATQHKGD